MEFNNESNETNNTIEEHIDNLDYNIAYAYFKQKEYGKAIDFFNRYANNSEKDNARKTHWTFPCDRR